MLDPLIDSHWFERQPRARTSIVDASVRLLEKGLPVLAACLMALLTLAPVVRADPQFCDQWYQKALGGGFDNCPQYPAPWKPKSPVSCMGGSAAGLPPSWGGDTPINRHSPNPAVEGPYKPGDPCYGTGPEFTD